MDVLQNNLKDYIRKYMIENKRGGKFDK